MMFFSCLSRVHCITEPPASTDLCHQHFVKPARTCPRLASRRTHANRRQLSHPPQPHSDIPGIDPASQVLPGGCTSLVIGLSLIMGEASGLNELAPSGVSWLGAVTASCYVKLLC